VYFSNRSHDTLFPVSGPLFQETKAEDGSGKYLYLIDPQSYAVSRTGPYAGILGPYSVDGMSRYVVNNVTGLWGMQVAELKTGRIVTASLADHPPGEPGLLHGIGWTPDEREVWQSSSAGDPHIYVWSMRDPMAPVLAERVSMKSRRGAHWVTFDIEGDYAYVAPNKSSDDATEIFDAHTHKSLGLIGSSEDMIEIDFADGKISRVGDQYGVGRVRVTSALVVAVTTQPSNGFGSRSSNTLVVPTVRSMFCHLEMSAACFLNSSACRGDDRRETRRDHPDDRALDAGNHEPVGSNRRVEFWRKACRRPAGGGC